MQRIVSAIRDDRNVPETYLGQFGTEDADPAHIPMLADASESDMEIIRSYGRSIGLAFQIVDDILDIVSTTEELGKDAGSDIEKGKATYPSIVGLEKSRERARELYEESIKALDGLKCDTSILRSIAAYIITRVK